MPFLSQTTGMVETNKLLPDVLDRIQSKLDEGQSAYSIARQEGISEGSIRYAVKQGRLKKSLLK